MTTLRIQEPSIEPLDWVFRALLVAAFVAVCLLLSGCEIKQVPAPAPDTAVLDTLKAISQKLDKPAPAPVVDLSPVERRIEGLAAKVESAETTVQKLAERPVQAQQVAQPATVQQSAPAKTRLSGGWTGCVAHLCGDERLCPPCGPAKRDLQKLNRETRWNVGIGEDNHIQVVYHERVDVTLPMFQFVRDGQIYHTIEGYEHDRESRKLNADFDFAEYEGPIARILEIHPSVDTKETKARKFSGRVGVERLGGTSGYSSSAYRYSGGSTGGYGGSGRARVMGTNANGSVRVTGDDSTTLGEIRAAAAEEENAQEWWNYRYQRAVQQSALQQYSAYQAYQSYQPAAYAWPVYQSYRVQGTGGRMHCVGGVCYPY